MFKSTYSTPMCERHPVLYFDSIENIQLYLKNGTMPMPLALTFATVKPNQYHRTYESYNITWSTIDTGTNWTHTL